MEILVAIVRMSKISVAITSEPATTRYWKQPFFAGVTTKELIMFQMCGTQQVDKSWRYIYSVWTRWRKRSSILLPPQGLHRNEVVHISDVQYFFNALHRCSGTTFHILPVDGRHFVIL